MIVKNAKYERTVVTLEQYPTEGYPEVAFAGRSNVGKSSIINSLTNRKNLAKTGATPGKTKEIIYFNLDDKLFLVDLPGYGFASVSKTQKRSWGSIVEGYLGKREELKMLVMMVDIRHTPTNDDKMMYGWLKDTGLSHVVVASKLDKISRSQLKARLDEIKKVLEVSDDIKIIPYSANNNAGVEELWNSIDSSLQQGQQLQ
jgi:ribosome biogenesis GTP-binding protein YsxC/EngB